MRKLNIPLIPVVFATLLLSGVIACSSGGAAEPTAPPIPPATAAANPTPTPEATLEVAPDGARVLRLHLAKNGSSQTGTAVITQVGNGIEVAIAVAPAAPFGQPVEIRRGSCPEGGEFFEQLDSLVGGTMSRLLDKRHIDTLTTGGYTIVVHEGFASLGTIVACADIPMLPVR